MGGEAWWYFVPYQKDQNKALQELKEREFAAGRYNPAEDFPSYPVNPNHMPGCKHQNIEHAIEEADADGTRSILDMEMVSPTKAHGVIVPLTVEQLEDYFGTDKPTRDMIEQCDDIFENVERGMGISCIAYVGDFPREIYFAGCSYD